jgi:hypothetical protein
MKNLQHRTLAGIGGPLCILAIMSIACASPEVRPYSIVAPQLSCERAHQLSQQVVERLGYTLSTMSPASNAEPGVIRGVRQGPRGEETVSVKISCTAEGVYIDANPDVTPCEQANQITRQSVERLGYAVDSFVPAVNEGRKGVVKGTKEEDGKRDTIMLTITCTNEAIFVDTRSDNPIVASADFTSAITDFRRGFFALFKPIADAEQRKQRR